MGFRFKQISVYSGKAARLSCGVTPRNSHKCKLLVVGSGAGGASVTWRLFKKLKKNEIIVLEPSDTHYYQPLFTLVAAGIKKFRQSHKPQCSVLPPGVTWLKDRAEDFDPCNNVVYTSCGDRICYEYMIVALGLKNDYDKIPGLKEALDNPTRNVSTIYSPDYCVKTWCTIKQFQGGHALFTFPQQGGKCSGAAQKIMYLADDYWRKQKTRHLTNITYNTGGDAIFGVPKYATALSRIASKRDLTVNCCVELVEIRKDGAVFTDKAGETITLPYNLLHVTPPMSPPTCLTKCDELVTNKGYLDVDMYTLQHRTFSNVYGIGDCTCTPNSKTAAAVSHQGCILESNILSTMSGKQPTAKYNGYGACPIVTCYRAGILAEFLYNKKVWETFPFDQSKERRFFYHLKKDFFPYIYWNKLLKGKWGGPSQLRKIINPFRK